MANLKWKLILLKSCQIIPFVFGGSFLIYNFGFSKSLLFYCYTHDKLTQFIFEISKNSQQDFLFDGSTTFCLHFSVELKYG